jgi:hypothetical protein
MSTKSYEHKILELDAGTWTVVGEQEPYQATLDSYGRQGWELVSTAPSGKELHVLMFFKRKTRSKHH